MLEVEAKIPVTNHEAVRRKLKLLGGHRLYTAVEHDTFFDDSHLNLSRSDEALRVRIDDRGKSNLTYKGPKKSSKIKVREELTLDTSDSLLVMKILSRLGFRKIASIKKTREAWKLKDQNVYLDIVKGLGKFVEVETMLRGSKYKTAQQRTFDLVDKLGLNPRSAILKSYIELAKEQTAR